MLFYDQTVATKFWYFQTAATEVGYFYTAETKIWYFQTLRTEVICVRDRRKKRKAKRDRRDRLKINRDRRDQRKINGDWLGRRKVNGNQKKTTGEKRSKEDAVKTIEREVFRPKKLSRKINDTGNEFLTLFFHQRDQKHQFFDRLEPTKTITDFEF